MKKTPAVLIFLGVLLIASTQFGGCEGFSLPVPIGPDPEKTAGSWVVVIEETQDRTPAITAVLTSAWWSGLSDRGLKWRHWDKDTNDPNAQGFIAKAEELPAFTVVMPDRGDGKGKVLAEGKLPETIAELDRIVKGATGR